MNPYITGPAVGAALGIVAACALVYIAETGLKIAEAEGLTVAKEVGGFPLPKSQLVGKEIILLKSNS